MNIVTSLSRTFFIISWLSGIVKTNAQDSIMTMAKNRWESHSSVEAYLLLDRAIYFSADSLSLPYYAQKATYKMMEGEFERAAWLWDKVYTLCADTLQQDEAILLKSYCQLRLNEMEKFYVSIEQVSHFNKRKTDEYRICALIYQGHIDSASSEAGFLFNDGRLNNAFSKCRKTLKRNENVPLVLNLLLPGLGHTCNGDFKNAANSFLLNGAMGILFYNTAINYQFIDGAMTLSPWVIRYYVGGARLAKKNCAQAKVDAKEKLVYLVLNSD